MFYLETNSLIDLFKKGITDQVKPNTAFTSIFALIEYLTGLNEKNYEYRKSNIIKLQNSNIIIDNNVFLYKFLDSFDLEYHQLIKANIENIMKVNRAHSSLINHLITSSSFEEFVTNLKDDKLIQWSRTDLLINKEYGNIAFNFNKANTIFVKKKIISMLPQLEKEMNENKEKKSLLLQSDITKNKDYRTIGGKEMLFLSFLLPFYLVQEFKLLTIVRFILFLVKLLFSKSKERKKIISDHKKYFIKLARKPNKCPSTGELLDSYNGKFDAYFNTFIYYFCDVVENKINVKKNDEKDLIHMLYVNQRTDQIVTNDKKLAFYANYSRSNPVAIGFNEFLKQL